MKQARCTSVGDFNDHALDLDQHCSLKDLQEKISITTGITAQKQILLWRGMFVGDDRIVTRIAAADYKELIDLIHVFSLDQSTFKDLDLDLNKLLIAKVPECGDIDEEWLMNYKELKKKLKCVIHKQEVLKEGEVQLRLHARDNLDVAMKSLKERLEVIKERNKHIKTILDFTTSIKNFLLTVDPGNDLLFDSLNRVEHLMKSYDKLTEKLKAYESIIKTSLETNKETSQLQSCEPDSCLDKIQKNIYNMETSCQKFKYATIGDDDELARQRLMHQSLKIAELVTSFREELKNMIEMYIAKIRSHLNSLRTASTVTDDVQLLSEDMAFEVILKKCKEDAENAKNMYLAGCQLGIGRSVQQTTRSPPMTKSPVSINSIESNWSDEDDGEDKEAIT